VKDWRIAGSDVVSFLVPFLVALYISFAVLVISSTVWHLTTIAASN